MKGWIIIILASFLFMTSACKNSDLDDVLVFDDNMQQIIFFSDNNRYEEEASYYDAIIELKKEFPDEIKNMKVITAANTKKYYDQFKIQNCPAIVLIHKKKVVLEIKGKATSAQIVSKLSNALQKDNL